MKPTASLTATLLVLPSTFALPSASASAAFAEPFESAFHEALQNMTIFEESASSHSKRQSIPDYCQPLDRIDATQTFSAIDVTDRCNANGIPGNCCVSFLRDRPWGCPSIHSPESQRHLSAGLREQGRKDGFAQFTQRGPFSFGWPTIATTALRRQEVVSAWVFALVEYNRVAAVIPENS